VGEEQKTAFQVLSAVSQVFIGVFFVLSVQFEGSLGKLTVSSVNNPRKMIDAVVTSRSEDDVSASKRSVHLW
jgi:hypothetical protein